MERNNSHELSLSSTCALWPLHMCVYAHRHTFFKDVANFFRSQTVFCTEMLPLIMDDYPHLSLKKSVAGDIAENSHAPKHEMTPSKITSSRTSSVHPRCSTVSGAGHHPHPCEGSYLTIFCPSESVCLLSPHHTTCQMKLLRSGAVHSCDSAGTFWHMPLYFPHALADTCAPAFPRSTSLPSRQATNHCIFVSALMCFERTSPFTMLTIHVFREDSLYNPHGNRRRIKVDFYLTQN